MEVLVFGAKNCAGCVTVKRVLEQKNVEFQSYDVNDAIDMNLAMEYRVRSIPTLVFKYEDGTHMYVGEKHCLEGISGHVGV